MTKDRNILIKNIYYMLAYAFQSLNQSYYEDVAKEEFDNIHNLFAAILSKGIGLQLKQGLYREYLNLQEDLSVMRGKINMSGTIKNRLQHKQLLNCEYDELSENNRLNQILKSTVFLLLSSEKVETKYKDDLKKEMLFFSNVDTLELQSVKWLNIRFQRNNQTYRVLIGICRLIVEGMLNTTEKGDYKLASFIDEQRMCRLYEKFILEYYRQTHPELSVNASKIPWALDDGSRRDMLPSMQSDITLQKGNKVLIIDAKYYNHSTQVRFGKNTIQSHNLYQIFTYVKNMDYSFGKTEHTVSGMLLYAKTDEEIQPDSDKPYKMHDNKIYVRTLDLYKDFSSIEEQLDDIAKKYFEDVNWL